MDCIFCKIVNETIPSYKVYEDNDVLAILDISQATKGHTLVMSKKHFENINDIDEKTYTKVMLAVKKVATIIQTKLNVKGVNILNNCNEIAGQTVMHFHVHVIPRYEKDDIDIAFVDHTNNYDKNQILKKLIK